jgi:hypothetical protein
MKEIKMCAPRETWQRQVRHRITWYPSREFGWFLPPVVPDTDGDGHRGRVGD